jgi:hypothetical protein
VGDGGSDDAGNTAGSNTWKTNKLKQLEGRPGRKQKESETGNRSGKRWKECDDRVGTNGDNKKSGNTKWKGLLRTCTDDRLSAASKQHQKCIKGLT